MLFFAGLKIWRLYKAKSSFFRQEMAGESVGCKIWGADTDQISNQQKNSVNPGLMLFFAGFKIWRLYKAKSSFFREEMAGEKRGVQDLRGWYWSDFKPAKKQHQSGLMLFFCRFENLEAV